MLQAEQGSREASRGAANWLADEAGLEEVLAAKAG